MTIGLDQRIGVTVIGATNRPDKIDPALTRPGCSFGLFFFVLTHCLVIPSHIWSDFLNDVCPRSFRSAA